MDTMFGELFQYHVDANNYGKIFFNSKGEDHFGESSQEYTGNEPEKDIINITLSRPLVFVQPVAVDRAILFWLSYKNEP